MPLKTLTHGEFNQTQAARNGGTYTGYLSYVAKHRAAKLAGQQQDPLAPTPDAQLQAQASSAVHAQVDPILKEILGSTNRAAAGIESATATHASRLEPFAGAARERYGRAAQETAGVAQTFADRLAGKGTEAAGSLRTTLEGINAPDRLTQELAGGVDSFGKGASNAGFGIDSAALDEIIARGATAEDYAGSLPGIARIAGVRSIGDVRAEGQKQIGEVRGKVPGLIADLMNSGRDREVNKAIAKLGLQETQAKLAAGAASDAYQATKPDSALSNTVGYLVDSNGVPIMGADGKPVPTTGTLDDQAGATDKRAAAVKERTTAIVTAKTTARDRARELFKGEKVTTGGGLIPGSSTVKRVGTAEAIRLILNDVTPSLARYGVKPGTALWKEIRQSVIDAVIDAGFQVGATGKTRPADAAASKPREG